VNDDLAPALDIPSLDHLRRRPENAIWTSLPLSCQMVSLTTFKALPGLAQPENKNFEMKLFVIILD
jgi:hypothetical protein